MVGYVIFLFLQEWRFGRSRSSKVIDFGTNRKHVCNFLVRNSNLGPILHHFGDIAAFMCSWPTLFHPNFGGVPVGPCRPCWGSMWAGTLSYSAVKLFSKYSNLCEKHTSTSETDRHRQTDGQTTYSRITARSVASRGKNNAIVMLIRLFAILAPWWPNVVSLFGAWKLWPVSWIERVGKKGGRRVEWGINNRGREKERLIAKWWPRITLSGYHVKLGFRTSSFYSASA